MPLDLDRLGEKKTKWFSLSGHLRGVELLILYAGPKEFELFQQKMVSEGIMKFKEGSPQINRGRTDDYFEAFAKRFILDWRGDIRFDSNAKEGETPEYTPQLGGAVLAAYRAAYDFLVDKIKDDAVFFENGDPE
jgi:hypothetical protein